MAFPCGTKAGLFLEMKSATGKPSGAQITVMAYLRAVGYEVAMPRSYEEFQTMIHLYLTE